MVPTPFGEGFTPEEGEAEHLREIDSRLQTLLSPAVFTSISSTSLMHRTIPNTVCCFDERKSFKAALTLIFSLSRLPVL